MSGGGRARSRAGARILYLLTDGYGGKGGIAAYNRDALRALCESGSVAEVVALPRLAPLPTGDLPPKLLYDLAAIGGAAAYLKVLLRHGRSGRFDLIYCAHVNLAPLARLAARLLRVPWLLAIYGIEAWEESPRRLVRQSVKRADHVVSISDVTLQRFLAFAPYPAERTSLLPNAIHLGDFGMADRNPEMERRWGLGGRKVLLTFGRMSASERYKGFDEMLEVLPSLSAKVPNICYLLAGDGDDRPRLEEKARQNGVSDRAVFTGYVDEREKPDLYRLADAYVMPSYGEGFGFVLIEAMACGVPVVASRTDGGREAVRDGLLGRLVDPEDPAAIEGAVLEALGEQKHIPQGLAYFDFPHFKARIERVVAGLVGKDISR